MDGQTDSERQTDRQTDILAIYNIYNIQYLFAIYDIYTWEKKNEEN